MNAQTLFALLIFLVAYPLQTSTPPRAPGAGFAGLLTQQRMEELVPSSVFFAGQVATTQVRNSGGVQAGEGKVTEFVLVDAGGYSSGIRERYQFYLLTSVPVEIEGKRLEAGAYGGGFMNGKALVMDLAARDVFQVPFGNDAAMKRPRPLQVLTSEQPGRYQLYLGREYVTFRQLS